MIVYVESEGLRLKVRSDIVHYSNLLKELCRSRICDGEVFVPLNDDGTTLSAEEIRSDLILADYFQAKNVILRVGRDLIEEVTARSPGDMSILLEREVKIILEHVEFRFLLIDAGLISVDESAIQLNSYQSEILYRTGIPTDKFDHWPLAIRSFLHWISSNGKIYARLANEIVKITTPSSVIEFFLVTARSEDEGIQVDQFRLNFLNYIYDSKNYGAFRVIVPTLKKRGILEDVKNLTREQIDIMIEIVADMIRYNTLEVKSTIRDLEKVVALDYFRLGSKMGTIFIQALKSNRYISELVKIVVNEKYLISIMDDFVNYNRGESLHLLEPYVSSEVKSRSEIMIGILNTKRLRLNDRNRRSEVIGSLTELDINSKYYSRLIIAAIRDDNLGMYVVLNGALKMECQCSIPIPDLVESSFLMFVSKLREGIKLSLIIPKKIRRSDVELIMRSQLRDWILQHVTFPDLISIMLRLSSMMLNSDLATEKYKLILNEILTVIDRDYANVIVNDIVLGRYFTDMEVSDLELVRVNSPSSSLILDRFTDLKYARMKQLKLAKLLKEVIIYKNHEEYKRIVDECNQQRLHPISYEEGGPYATVIKLTPEAIESNEILNDIFFNQSTGRYRFVLMIQIMGDEIENKHWLDQYRFGDVLRCQQKSNYKFSK